MVTVFLLFTVFFLLYFRWSKKSYWSQLGIQEIPGLPIIGNILPTILRRRAYFELMDDLYNFSKEEKYFGIYAGLRPVLIIRDPDLIDTIFREEARNFEDRGLCPDVSDPYSMNLFFLKGKLWKWTRSKLRPAFSIERLKIAYEGIQTCATLCSDSLGSAVNIKQTMDKFTCDVIAKTVFCLQDNTGFVENTKEALSLSGFAGIPVFLRLFVPRFALLIGIKTVNQKIGNFYKKAISKSTRIPGSFLDLMLHLTETESVFNEDFMAAQFFIFILAGFETTAYTLTFSLYLLSKHPEVQKKARTEIENVYKEHGRNYDSLKKLIYLELVINEVLRLYPPVAYMFRIAEKPLKLPCGAVLPPGSGVMALLYSLQRDPRFYKDPLKFVPERWEKPHRVYYPFGLGPRICIGMQFATIEMKILLAEVLLKYNIKLNSATVEPLKFDPTNLFCSAIPPILLDFEKI